MSYDRLNHLNLISQLLADSCGSDHLDICVYHAQNYVAEVSDSREFAISKRDKIEYLVKEEAAKGYESLIAKLNYMIQESR